MPSLRHRLPATPGYRRCWATRCSSATAPPAVHSRGCGDGDADTDHTDDARWGDSEPRLVELLRDEILAAPRQRITFARFMERALTEPGLGYYASSELRPTRSGDFLTAPELHPVFGHCLGRFVADAWQRTGSADVFVVREYGAGRGTLRDAVLNGLRADESELVERIEWQAYDLPRYPLEGTATPGPDLVLANEYLDALPVHRVVAREGLKEIYVGWQDDWFSEAIGEPSSDALSRYLEADGVTLAPGQRAEICLEAPAWMTGVAADAASVLLIDYGHTAAELYGPRRLAGSLLTYRGHTVSDEPLQAVGRSDITAHVDLTAIERAARDAGLELIGSTTQARFLAALGLGEILAKLGQDPATDIEAYVAARSAVARLLDPRHLGGFRVLAWQRGGAAPAAFARGFDEPA